MLTASA